MFELFKEFIFKEFFLKNFLWNTFSLSEKKSHYVFEIRERISFLCSKSDRDHIDQDPWRVIDWICQ